MKAYRPEVCWNLRNNGDDDSSEVEAETSVLNVNMYSIDSLKPNKENKKVYRSVGCNWHPAAVYIELMLEKTLAQQRTRKQKLN